LGLPDWKERSRDPQFKREHIERVFQKPYDEVSQNGLYLGKSVFEKVAARPVSSTLMTLPLFRSTSFETKSAGTRT
jgi:hypothetical protein